MASTSVKKKPYAATFVYGVAVIAMYAGLLTNQDLINTTFAKGGWYALLPIATAFILSFAHGNFTGNFWSALGVEASRKTTGGK